jgi:hypothetical protein
MLASATPALVTPAPASTPKAAPAPLHGPEPLPGDMSLEPFAARSARPGYADADLGDLDDLDDRRSEPAPASEALVAEAARARRDGIAELSPRRTTTPLPGSTDRSTWERISVVPDIEIHVRRPLAPRAVKKLDVLLRMARDLFSEDS